MDQFTLTLNSPITEEQFDAIMDVDFENTERVCFNTKHGAVVEFVKWKEPKTNGDRIRAMTDEELASYITGVWYGFEELPGMCDVCDKNSVQNCGECWLDWLKQEAVE